MKRVHYLLGYKVINKYKEVRFTGELIVMEADSHYYLSCCLMPWDRRGSLYVLWLAAWADEVAYAGQYLERRGCDAAC